MELHGFVEEASCLGEVSLNKVCLIARDFALRQATMTL